MTVQEMLDALVDGSLSIEEAAAMIRERRWSERTQPSEAVAYGVEDESVADNDSWVTVEADGRLTADQYAALAQAHSDTFSRN